MVERLLNIIFCVPFGTQSSPRDKKRAPLSRGLEEEEPAWNYFQTGGRFLFLFFRPNLMTDPHSK